MKKINNELDFLQISVIPPITLITIEKFSICFSNNSTNGINALEFRNEVFILEFPIHKHQTAKAAC